MAKGDQARSEILAAARRLFLAKGYASVSMRDIAREAGNRAVAGIYNHFPSKQAVFQALIKEIMPPTEALDLLSAVQGISARDFLSNLMRTGLPFLKTYDEFFEIAQIDVREFGGENIGYVIEHLFMPRALGIVQKLMTFPDLRPADPVAILRLIVSMTLGYLMTRRFAPRILIEHLSDEAWIEAYISLITHGLCREQEKDSYA